MGPAKIFPAEMQLEKVLVPAAHGHTNIFGPVEEEVGWGGGIAALSLHPSFHLCPPAGTSRAAGLLVVAR